MVLSYAEAVEKCGNAYRLSKELENGRIFKHDEGVYSTRQYESELSVIMKKYPKAVLTGEYAFYCHGLTDVIPEKYDLATPSKSARLRDKRVHQVYVREDVFPMGVEDKEIEGSTIKIYDKERMLIELLRNKKSMPYDLYKEILLNYRVIINDLELWRIQEYASAFPKSKMISKALDEEVL